MSEVDAYARGVADTLGLVRQVADVAPAALILAGGQAPTMRRLGAILTTIDPAILHVLRPFDRAEAIDVRLAAKIAGRSESAIRTWVARYAIGRRVVGSLQVSRPALNMLLDDAPIALAAYLSGDRSSPLVRAYFDRSRVAA